jgi:hypothetical protein
MRSPFYRPALFVAVVLLALLAAWGASGSPSILGVAGIVGIVLCFLALMGVWTDPVLGSATRVAASLLSLVVAVSAIFMYLDFVRTLSATPKTAQPATAPDKRALP